jgi:hypothetical protein
MAASYVAGFFLPLGLEQEGHRGPCRWRIEKMRTDFQREETIMLVPTSTKSDNQIDKTVRRLDDFPELLHALRDGDLLTGRLFCAQLFDCAGRINHLGELKTEKKAN